MTTRVSFAVPLVVHKSTAPVPLPQTTPAASLVQNKLQTTPFSPPQSPSLVGRTTFAPIENEVPEEVMQEVCKAIGDLFPGKIGTLYSDLLKETQDLNVQYDGWSLLHYCMYQIDRVPEGKKHYLFDLIRYLVREGARLDLEDDRGRVADFVCLFGRLSDRWGILGFSYREGCRAKPIRLLHPPSACGV